MRDSNDNNRSLASLFRLPGGGPRRQWTAIVTVVVLYYRRLEELLPSKTLARLLKSELEVLRFAFGRLPAVQLPNGAAAFTIHESSGAGSLFWMLAAITPVEAAGLHWLLPAKWAWILTVLSIYCAVWLVAVARSFGALPIVVDTGGVTLRRGLLATLRVPWDAVATVSRKADAEFKYVRFAVLAEPTIWLTFDRPLTLELPFGFTRQVKGASASPDQPAQFRAELERHLDAAK